MLTRIPKKGDKVRCLRTVWDRTAGSIYTVVNSEDYDRKRFFIIDDVGDTVPYSESQFHEFELVSAATPPQPVGRITLGAVQTKHTSHIDVHSYSVVVHADSTGYATLQRLAEESDNQARRGVIERQITELQRELEALE